jgi:hypothetical protein
MVFARLAFAWLRTVSVAVAVAMPPALASAASPAADDTTTTPPAPPATPPAPDPDVAPTTTPEPPPRSPGPDATTPPVPSGPEPAPAVPQPPYDPMPDNGRSNMLGGVVISVLGVPMLVIGGVVLHRYPRYDREDLGGKAAIVLGPTCVVLGSLVFLAGVAVLGYGGVQRRRYKQWEARQPPRVRPNATRTPYGTWAAGLELRF